MAQQVAALAAGRQAKAWDFVETFYAEQGEENSGYVTDSYLHGIASQIANLNLEKWDRERRDQELAKAIIGDASQRSNNETCPLGHAPSHGILPSLSRPAIA